MFPQEIYLLVLFVFFLPNSTSLQCYHCDTDKEATCQNAPNLITCSPNQQGACMTVSYKTTKDGKGVNNYRKGCWDSYNNCLSYCSSPEALDVMEDCKRKCCTTDKCNADGFNDDFKDKTRRAMDQENGDRTLSYSFSMLFISIVSYFIAGII